MSQGTTAIANGCSPPYYFDGGNRILNRKNKCNILFFVCDTLRADRLSSYGYFRKTSPNIDTLANEGILFEKHYCSGISTGNAFTSIFTGLPAISHKYYATPARAFNIARFDDTIPTLPEIIQSNTDYSTIAIDNLINFAGHMNQTARGFQFYLNPTRESGFPHPEYHAGEANEMLIPWLRQYGKKPFFAFVHYWDPHHTPYSAPGYRTRFQQEHNRYDGLPIKKANAGYEYVPGWGRVEDMYWGVSISEKAQQVDAQVDGGFGGSVKADKTEKSISQDLYDCSIAYMDHQISEILSVLKQENILDNTIIIITADHGEGLGNHGVWGHGLLYEDTIHIPLIMWQPNVFKHKKRVKSFTQHVDLAPTIMDLIGIPDSSVCRLGDRYSWQKKGSGDVAVQMEGHTLIPLTTDQPAKIRDSAITEVRRGPKDPGFRSIIDEDNWKLIRKLNGDMQLYNLDNDPMEKINLATSEPSRLKDLSKKLDDWVQNHIRDTGIDPMAEW